MTVHVHELVTALFAGSLTFIPTTKQNENFIAPVEYPEHMLKIARFRFEVIKPLLDLPKRTLSAIKNRLAELKQTGGVKQLHVSVPSIYRWLCTYEGSGDLRSLMPAVAHRGGNGKNRLPRMLTP